MTDGPYKIILDPSLTTEKLAARKLRVCSGATSFDAFFLCTADPHSTQQIIVEDPQDMRNLYRVYTGAGQEYGLIKPRNIYLCSGTVRKLMVMMWSQPWDPADTYTNTAPAPAVPTTSGSNPPVITSAAPSLYVYAAVFPWIFTVSASGYLGHGVTWSLSQAASYGTVTGLGTFPSASIHYIPVSGVRGDDYFLLRCTDDISGDYTEVKITAHISDGPYVISNTPADIQAAHTATDNTVILRPQQFTVCTGSNPFSSQDMTFICGDAYPLGEASGTAPFLYLPTPRSGICPTGCISDGPCGNGCVDYGAVDGGCTNTTLYVHISGYSGEVDGSYTITLGQNVCSTFFVPLGGYCWHGVYTNAYFPSTTIELSLFPSAIGPSFCPGNAWELAITLTGHYGVTLTGWRTRTSRCGVSDAYGDYGISGATVTVTTTP